WKNAPALVATSVTIDLIDTFRAVMLEKAGSDPEKRQNAEAFAAALEARNPQLRSIEVATAKLVENPAGRAPSNAYRAAGVLAIRTISAALAYGCCQTAAPSLAFPPAPSASTEKRILPSRDWVLSHRRRANSCDCCAPE